MKRYIYTFKGILISLSMLILACACNTEDDPMISEKQDTRYNLPQGDHDFDDQIVEWAEKYGTNVLYKFSNADLNYKFTKNDKYELAAEAEEESIRTVIKFLKEDFFDLYPDEIKEKFFPSKILLCGMLYETGKYEPLLDTLSIEFYDKDATGIFLRGMDHITFPRVDKDFSERIQKPKFKERLKLALNLTFIDFIMFPTNEILAKIPATEILNTFGSYTLLSEAAIENNVTDPYSYSGNKWYNEEDKYKLGFLKFGSYWYFTKPYYWNPVTKQEDFYSYIAFIFSQTKSELQANPLYTNYPQIQKKCDYLIEVFAEYGIDLHCVGKE